MVLSKHLRKSDNSNSLEYQLDKDKTGQKVGDEDETWTKQFGVKSQNWMLKSRNQRLKLKSNNKLEFMGQN